MLRMELHELCPSISSRPSSSCRTTGTLLTPDRRPQRRDRLDVLVQRQGKAVHLVLVLHHKERVVRCGEASATAIRCRVSASARCLREDSLRSQKNLTDGS